MRRQQPAEDAAAPVARSTPLVFGKVAVRRAHFLRFPAYELATEQGFTLGLARYSSLNIYFFGPGQKIALPWGVAWRLTAVARHAGLAAVVGNERRERLAVAAPGAVAGNYGINGRDYAYTLNPAEGGLGRARLWDLFAGDEPAARFTRYPFGARCAAPIPLPAVLLCLLLVRFSIPGENELRLPALNWGPGK
jgi:hypothetical protein